jgi:hypothetical protein
VKIQSVKRIKLNKIGTVAAVFILCCISFTAGVDLTQNANSAGSSSVLPVAKGGTGGNTASIAATNILGTNYENYSGILPLAKGGLGVNATPAAGQETAQQNLGLPRRYRLPLKQDPGYMKIAEARGNETYRDNTGQSILISGLARIGTVPFTAILSYGSPTNVSTGNPWIAAKLVFFDNRPCDGGYTDNDYQLRWIFNRETGLYEFWMKFATNWKYGSTTLTYLNNVPSPSTFTPVWSTTEPTPSTETETGTVPFVCTAFTTPAP